jgi:N-acetylglucosaminyldiphosphoundecaprenol N-acetyl-beta-D-mannosaminyltransferase
MNSSATPLKKFPVLSSPVHLLDDYTQWLVDRMQQGQGVQVVTLNAEMAMQAEQIPELGAIIDQAELVIPDGAGVVLYLRLKGERSQRCPGIELAASLLQKAGELGSDYPVVFYGGAVGVAATAATKLQAKYPGLAIASVQHGYLPPADMPAFLTQLAEMQPKIILVGLGVPRQELWIANHRHLCPQAIWIGVGGSFDIWAEVKTRAPGWLRDNHLEWLYRLYQEPWRWRRMAALPKFALRALFSKN